MSLPNVCVWQGHTLLASPIYTSASLTSNDNTHANMKQRLSISSGSNGTHNALGHATVRLLNRKLPLVMQQIIKTQPIVEHQHLNKRINYDHWLRAFLQLIFSLWDSRYYVETWHPIVCVSRLVKLKISVTIYWITIQKSLHQIQFNLTTTTANSRESFHWWFVTIVRCIVIFILVNRQCLEYKRSRNWKMKILHSVSLMRCLLMWFYR